MVLRCFRRDCCYFADFPQQGCRRSAVAEGRSVLFVGRESSGPQMIFPWLDVCIDELAVRCRVYLVKKHAGPSRGNGRSFRGFLTRRLVVGHREEVERGKIQDVCAMAWSCERVPDGWPHVLSLRVSTPQKKKHMHTAASSCGSTIKLLCLNILPQYQQEAYCD